MIQQLIRYGFMKEAYGQMQPMVKRVVNNNGFFEWYSVNNKPRGSGTFRVIYNPSLSPSTPIYAIIPGV